MPHTSLVTKGHMDDCERIDTQAACTAMGSSNRGLLDTCVAPAAADAAASMLESATDNRKRIQKYLARLKEVLTALDAL